MNARVVCRVMDCGTAQTAKSNSFFGPGDGDIWLDDVKCLGNESSLLHCEHNKMGENNCGHLEDAGVVCSGTLYFYQLLLSCVLHFSFLFSLIFTTMVTKQSAQ